MAIVKDLIVQGASRTVGDVRGKKFVVDNGTSSQFMKADGTLDSNTYLTSSSNLNASNLTSGTLAKARHYTPSAEAGSEITASIEGTAGSYAKDTLYTVLTGVKAQRDSLGHVTGITYTAQQIKDTNNTYTVNNGTFSVKTKVGTASAVTAADFTANQSAADDVTFIQGDNITLTTDTTNRTITIAGTANTTYSFANGTSTTGTGTFTVTPAGGSAQTVTVYGVQGQVAKLGSTTKPVYTSAAGTFAECSTYAGGTAVTLNGSSKAASTASFYAPTAAGTNGQFLMSSGSGAPSWVANPNTDTSVTAVANHYTPSADSSAEKTATIDGTAGAYALNTEYTVLTGVKAQMDAAGHVTGLTYTAQKIKDTNTTYSSKAASSGGTDVSLCTTGEKYTWNSKQGQVAKLGSTTKPVYTSAAGTFAECSTYAGGTAVTLNGTDKSATTATIYAPTAAGTQGQFLAADASGIPTWVNNPNTNSATLQVGDATNKKINTSETTGHYIQFTGGTNKFTVTDGTNSFDVGVTPSISNNVTGSGLTNNAIVLGSGSSGVKTSSKTISTTAPSSNSDDTTLPTSKAVWTAISDGIATADAMVYKGTIAGGSTGSYGALTAAASKGWTYKVTTAGKIDGVAVEVGDMLICNTDNTAAATSSNYTTIAANWDFIQTNLDGVVTGPASSTANHVAVFDGTTGKVIKDGTYTISKSVPSNAVFTDASVTAVGNHYTPIGTDTKSASGATGTAGSTVQVVTGVTVDAAGHVTAVTSGAATDTTYSSKTAASGGTAVSLCTTGEKYTWNGKYTLPSTGIPSTDLASGVQTSLGLADSALQSHQTIKQDGITGATIKRYGSCSTGASTQRKDVTISNGTFSLEAGLIVAVNFANANTANNPTLSVGGSSGTAKNIFCNGSQITTGTNKAMLKGTCLFVYDGTQYHLIGNYETYSSKAASSGGTDVSLVTTGEKYTWNSKQSQVAQLGSTTKPVYTSAAGTFAECSTYAGGTAVTLNGTDKSATTASFYAPTSAGTSGQFLQSAGSGAPSWASITQGHSAGDASTLTTGTSTTANSWSASVLATAIGVGAGTASSVSSVAVGKKFVVITVSPTSTQSTQSGTFTLASVPSAGREIHAIIKNTSANYDFTMTIPHGTVSSIPYVNTVDNAQGGSIVVKKGSAGYVELNCLSDGTNVYVRYA